MRRLAPRLPFAWSRVSAAASAACQSASPAAGAATASVWRDGLQALGDDAVEGGDEVVGVDAHVHEAADDVEHVVGVHGGEHQVAGERRLDGDLGGLRRRGSRRP
jgi:hypothetical protein